MLLFKWNGETLTFRQITHFQAQSIGLTCNYCANVLNQTAFRCLPYCSTTLATTDQLATIDYPVAVGTTRMKVASSTTRWTITHSVTLHIRITVINGYV
jgi:hypothetical protein